MEDNVFFMAGAITFNVLIAFVPLVLLFIGISGFVLTSQANPADPGARLIEFLLGVLPQTGGDVDLRETVETIVNPLVTTVVEDRAGLSVVGILVFLWISTRLVGTLRTALREVFDFPHGRGIIHGKLFDGFMVVVGGFSLVNLGITIVLETVEGFGLDLLGFQGQAPSLIRQGSAQLLAFGSIFVLFILIYRFFPPRRIPWRTALAAATFTAVLFEVSKVLFSWYVTNVPNYSSAYGGLSSAAVLFFWIYYGAVVFILGGEVAQVYTMSRTRRLHAAGGPLRGNG